jgi:hypothetical protein
MIIIKLFLLACEVYFDSIDLRVKFVRTHDNDETSISSRCSG